MSPTTVFPAAAKCMSSNRGPFWDWPPSTPDINAQQLVLTLPFNMPTTPRHNTYEVKGLCYGLICFFIWTCAITTTTTPVSAWLQTGETLFCVAGHVSARLGFHFSSLRAQSLSLFLSVYCVVFWVKK